MLALSIRQPFAELILRGIKTVEYRSRPTRFIGRRFYIYALKKPAVGGGRVGDNRGIWSRDLTVPSGEVPAWMLELAEQAGMIEPGTLLPAGVIVGSAVIEKVSAIQDVYRWHLVDVERAKKLRKPQHQPQPVWFNPFGTAARKATKHFPN